MSQNSKVDGGSFAPHDAVASPSSEQAGWPFARSTWAGKKDPSTKIVIDSDGKLFLKSVHFGMILTPAQCRAARGLVEWSQDQLAVRARVGNSTVRDFEKGRRIPSDESLAAIRRALEDAGVEFIPAKNGKGVGVRLRKINSDDP